jgi:hypothetical protein
VGATGATGAAGPPGAIGATGATGLSDLYVKGQTTNVSIGSSDTTVMSLDLPVGSYLVIGHVNLDNTTATAQAARCSISIPAGGFGDDAVVPARGPAVGDGIGSFNMQGAATLVSAATITMSCHTSTQEVAFSGDILATKVGAIH